jgi:Zn-dependent peptidase ImmA (M78 family)
MIVHNDGHSVGRQNSNLSHELAHGLLMHPPTPAVDDRGCRHWNQGIEDEATWLGSCLLVTKEAAMEVALERWTSSHACARLGISEHMLTYRMRMTGATTIVKRARARRPG